MKSSMFPILALALILSQSTDGSCAAAIRAGLAKVDITPPIGGTTTGYSDAPATDGVHDPVEARVLVLQSDEANVALVTWDLCIFNSPWLHEQKESLGLDVLLLSNTHTHAGPNLRQKDFPTVEAPWRRAVEEKTLSAIKEAQANLFPAMIDAGEGEIPLGYNRLLRQPGGFSLTQFNNPERVPYGPIDPTVGVLRIRDVDGAARVVLVNHACHPVVLGPRNRKISAGFPGVMRREIEKAIGGDVMGFFVQGGAGDVNPLILARETDDRSRDFELVEALGMLLKSEVMTILERMGDGAGRSDRFQSASSVISVSHRFEAGERMELGVATLMINGEIGIVTMPGEPFHKFQQDLRELAEVPFTFFFGYTSNAGYPWPSYLPDVLSAAYGGYGASETTRAEVGAGERLLHLGVAQLYRLQGRLKDRPMRLVK